MSFQFLNGGRSGDIQEITPIDTFIDPVSKIRVSNPSNLIDTDFEYGLQPTKWETVELINNTPAFFSRGGDTTIPDITGITTNAGTREITVTTAFPHELDVGIPIRVAGTKSVTADGSYIINATPTLTTFTYLSRANQAETVSIFDLYTSIISGEFFQGSQISISDAEGMVTDGDGPSSTITVKTETKHGFGPSTPFYFLNLNSTISQEFESQNTASVSFDPTNAATAQQFDGSNTLLQTPIDLSNSATSIIAESPITSSSAANNTITVSFPDEDWSTLQFGDPLYYSATAGFGYFQETPRGVVFILSVDQVDSVNKTATFQVSSIPNGNPVSVANNMTGFFQIADQARTFAGNNVNEQSQIELQIEVGQEFLFDGGNQGFEGDPEEPVNNVATVVGYTGTTITVFTSEGSLDYYEGAMLKYESDGDDATGLASNTTYFVTAFAAGQSAGLFTISVAALPGESNISISGGSGTQTFSKIGVSIDKNIVHIKDSDFLLSDMLEYTFPENGNFGADLEKRFYFVRTKYDEHNYILAITANENIEALGGTTVSTVQFDGESYTVHSFTQAGTFSFEVVKAGTFGQDIRFVTTSGSTFNGQSTAEGIFVPEEGVFTVVVASAGRVDIAYPEGSETNNIPFPNLNPLPLVATGGTETTINVLGTSYRLHSFNNVGNSTFTVSSLGNLGNTVDYLIVAGGGGAGRGDNGQGGGGGGGAGGMLDGNVSVTATSYGVTVGSGGGSNSSNGNNSVALGLTAIGGGRGIGDNNQARAGDGGSGGGEFRSLGGGFGTSGQGNNGGTGSSSIFTGGGGGGGAGSAGIGNTGNQTAGRNGGAAKISSITGTALYYAGGGGGGGHRNTGGQGGGTTVTAQKGGAGNGGTRNANGQSGAANTGGGAGGGSGGDGTARSGGSGGSGVVIIRYPLEPVT